MPVLLANIANIDHDRKHPHSFLTPYPSPFLMPPKSVALFNTDTPDEDDEDDLPPLVEPPPYPDDASQLPPLVDAPRPELPTLSLTLSPTLREHVSTARSADAGTDSGEGAQYTFATTMTPSAFGAQSLSPTRTSAVDALRPSMSFPLYPPGLNVPRVQGASFSTFHAQPFSTQTIAGVGDAPSPSNADMGSPSPAPASSPSFTDSAQQTRTETLSLGTESPNLDEQVDSSFGPARTSTTASFGTGQAQGQGGGSRKRPPSYIPRPPNAFILFRASFVRNQRVEGSAPVSVSALGPSSVVTITSSSPPSPSPSAKGRNSKAGNAGKGVVEVAVGGKDGTKGTTPSTSLSKLAGVLWHSMPAHEKEVWEQKARAARAEHRAKYPDWRFRPENASGVGVGVDDWGGGGGGGGTSTGAGKRSREKDKDRDRDRDKERVKRRGKGKRSADGPSTNARKDAGSKLSPNRSSSTNPTFNTVVNAGTNSFTGASANVSSSMLGLPSWAIAGLGLSSEDDGFGVSDSPSPGPIASALKTDAEEGPKAEAKHRAQEVSVSSAPSTSPVTGSTRGVPGSISQDVTHGEELDATKIRIQPGIEVEPGPEVRPGHETESQEQEQRQDARFVVSLTDIARRSVSTTPANVEAQEGSGPGAASSAGPACRAELDPSGLNYSASPHSNADSHTASNTDRGYNPVALVKSSEENAKQEQVYAEQGNKEGQAQRQDQESEDGRGLMRNFDLRGAYFPGPVGTQARRGSQSQSQPHSRSHSISEAHSQAELEMQTQRANHPQALNLTPTQNRFLPRGAYVRAGDSGAVRTTRRYTMPTQASIPARSPFRMGFPGSDAYGYTQMYGYERLVDFEQASPPPLSPSLSSPISASSPTYGQASSPFSLPVAAHTYHSHPYANARQQQLQHQHQHQHQGTQMQNPGHASSVLSPSPMMLSARTHEGAFSAPFAHPHGIVVQDREHESPNMNMDGNVDVRMSAPVFSPVQTHMSSDPGTSRIPHHSSYSSLAGWAGASSGAGFGTASVSGTSAGTESVIGPDTGSELDAGYSGTSSAFVSPGYELAYPYSDFGSEASASTSAFPEYFQYEYGYGFEQTYGEGRGPGGESFGLGNVSGNASGDAIAYGPGPNPTTPTPSPTEGAGESSRSSQTHMIEQFQPQGQNQSRPQLLFPGSNLSNGFASTLDLASRHRQGTAHFASGVDVGGGRGMGRSSGGAGGEGPYVSERYASVPGMTGSVAERAKERKK